jgi:hypothetical protein
MKIDLKICESVNWVKLAQYGVPWQAFVNTALELRVT